MRNRKLWVSVLSGVLAAIMLLTLILGILPSVADAASMSELEGLKAEQEKKKNEIDAELSDLRDKYSDNLNSMEEMINQKNLIDQEIFMLYEKVANLNEQIATQNQLIAEKQAELDAEQARLDQLNEDNKDRIRAMEEQGHMTYWSVLFKANSFSDLLDRLNMVNEIAAADQRRLKEISDSAKLVAETKTSLEAEKTDMEASKAELEQSQVELEAKREEANKILNNLIAIGADYEAQIHEAEEKAAVIGSQLDATNDAIDALNRPATPPPGSSGGSVIVDGLTWVTPCSYRLLTSPFGWRVHPVYGDWRFHYGVDLASPMGTPIVATRSGVVTTATYDSSAGYYVTIDHQDGFSSKYLHMTHYVVSSGDYVAAGQVIGYMGSTGTSTGSHLHFSILYNGEHMNPMDYIS